MVFLGALLKCRNFYLVTKLICNVEKQELRAFFYFIFLFLMNVTIVFKMLKKHLGYWLTFHFLKQSEKIDMKHF